MAANGRVYGSGGYPSANNVVHMWEYDPVSGWPDDLGDVLGDQSVNVLVAGLDGRIYGGTNTYDGASGALFVFNPQLKVFTNLTPSYGMCPTGGVYVLAVGPDGRIHGGARKNGWVPYMFTYDPAADSFIDTGRFSRRAISDGLAGGPDGRVYATAYGYGAVTEALLEYSPALGGFEAWDRVEFGATLPTGTGLRIDVLDDLGNTLLSNVASGASLAGISLAPTPPCNCASVYAVPAPRPHCLTSGRSRGNAASLNPANRQSKQCPTVIGIGRRPGVGRASPTSLTPFASGPA